MNLIICFYIFLERCRADKIESEGDILQTFTVEGTVEGASKEGATTGTFLLNSSI